MDAYIETTKYRRDIDGLRAVAIMAVVLYHAFPWLLTGGFVGVDIFFVISGYLISTIIFTHFDAGNFSYVGFYAKRIRRIFPALIIVTLVTMVIGYCVETPTEYSALGSMTFAASLFLANFLQIKNYGYFDIASEYKPLLHMWSLGVEEQFYIIFPVFTVVVWKRIGYIRAVIIITAISFLFSLYLSFSTELTLRWANNVLAYYLPLSRFWELMIGAILAHINIRHPSILRWRPQLQSSVGLGLIAVGITLTTKTSMFPGWLALLPTFGTFLVISAGPQALGNKLVLANPVMVWLGLISYPLYLWHWPLLSFLLIMEGGMRTTFQSIITVVFSVICAYTTFILVEKPIRFRLRANWVIAALCVALFTIGSGGLLIKIMGGLPSRVVARLNAMDNVVGDASPLLLPECGLSPQEKAQIGECVTDKRAAPAFAVLGDSKAAALFPSLVMASTDAGRWMLIGGNGPFGAPIPLISNAPIYQKFQKMTEIAIDTIINNSSIKVVVLVTAVRSIFQSDDTLLRNLNNKNVDTAFNGLNKVITKFSASGKSVIIVLDNPPLADPILCMSRKTGIDVIDALFRHRANGSCTIPVNEYRGRIAPYLQVISQIKDQWGDSVMIYDMTSILCSGNDRICRSESDGHMLYSYGDHLSGYGADLIARDFIPRAEQFARLSPH